MPRRKPGIYAHITPNLPKLPLIEPERRDIVNAVRAEILKPEEAPLIGQGEALSHLLSDLETAFKKILALETRRTGGRRYCSEYAKAYAELRIIKDQFTVWEANLQVLLDAYTELLSQQMDAEGVTSQSLVGGGRVSKHEEPYGQVKDAEAFRQWCIDNGYEQQLRLWPATMNNLVKERVLAGEKEPDGVEIFAITRFKFDRP